MSSATWVVDSITGSWRPARAPIKDILAEIPTCTFCEEKGHGEQDCHQANLAGPGMKFGPVLTPPTWQGPSPMALMPS